MTEEHHEHPEDAEGDEIPESWKSEINLSEVDPDRRIQRWAGAILLTLIISPIVIFIYHWVYPPKAPVFPLQVVQYIKIRSRQMYHKVTVPSGIRSFRQSIIYAHVPGYLKTLNVDKGDFVHKGQILAYIQDPELQQSLEQKRADVRIQYLTYRRIKRVWLSHPSLISEQRVQEKLAGYLASVSAMRHDEALVAYKTIRAPYDGMITHRFVDQGKLISQGTEQTASVQPIVTLEQVGTLRAYVWVPADVVPHIRRGQKVSVRLAGLPGKVFEGRVTRFDSEENLRTRTMRTEVDIDNKDLEIHPGMYGQFTFYLEKLPKAILLPGGAVRSEKGKGLSVATVENGTIHIRPISIGIDNANWVQVDSGLSPGDRVVMMGKWHVHEGQKVQAIPYKGVPFRPARQL
ncbi:MAG: efflux RND transporter periplasmic adaptor subunit [Leptospirales bacterium]